MKASKWINSITFKMLVIGVIIVVLMVPLLLVQNVIYEREEYQSKTYSEIASSWGHDQLIEGPVLTIPYEQLEKKEFRLANGETLIERESETKYAHFLPAQLNISGELIPQTLHRGIYEVPVYTADLLVSGEFSAAHSEDWNDSTKVHWDDAFISIGLKENKGIDELQFTANGQPVHIRPGMRGDSAPLLQGVHAQYSPPKESWKFTMDLSLKGSESFSIVPVGAHTRVDLESAWTAPSFFGAFLPDERPEDFENGFHATWDILEINRSIPSQLSEERVNLAPFAFGVKLKEEVSDYSKTEKSTKYALLFIVLVFISLIVIQLLRGFWFHPLQLGILGIGLVLFYLLLLSLSEIIGFNLAFLTASLVMTLQMGWYLHSLIGNLKTTLVCVLVLMVLYVFTFILVQMVMYSLLVGSIGLVIALALIMAVSRKLPKFSAKLDKASGPLIGA